MLVFYFMEWKEVYYNDLETNIEVTRCGKVRRVHKKWMSTHKLIKYGEVDFSKLKKCKGYLLIGIYVNGLKLKKSTYVHQLVAAAFLDYKFQGHELVIDHIDSNKINNNLDNLRLITNRENCSKERTLKTNLPVGVWFDKTRNNYQCKIRINKKQYHLGRFKTIDEASQAYQNKLNTLNQ